MMSDQTLVFILRGNRVLLGMKKRGFGEGKLNGYGGKRDQEETMRRCAVRELEEESGLVVEESDLEDLGYIQFLKNGVIKRKVQIYRLFLSKGDPEESEEMRPEWHKLDAIPYARMWDDCWYWVRHMVRGTAFEATFTLNDDGISKIHIVLK